MLANAGERALLASGDHWGWGAAAVTIVGTPLVAVAEPCSWPLQVACFVTPLLQWKSVNHLETQFGCDIPTVYDDLVNSLCS